MCPPGKKTVETANANYEKAKPTPPPHKTTWLWKSLQGHPSTTRT